VGFITTQINLLAKSEELAIGRQKIVLATFEFDSQVPYFPILLWFRVAHHQKPCRVPLEGQFSRVAGCPGLTPARETITQPIPNLFNDLGGCAERQSGFLPATPFG